MGDGAIAVHVKGTREVGLLPHLHINGVARSDALGPGVSARGQDEKKKA
jgi:hypothetical protein